MLVDFTDTQRLLQQTMRRLARQEIAPRAAAMDQAACYDDDLLRLLFDAGLMRLRIPEAYGGLGADAVTMCLVLEEAAKVDLASADILSTASVHVQPVSAYGTPAQQAMFFGRMINDQVLTSFALTEPEAGSDPAAMQTRAVLTAEGYRLQGHKCFITNAASAELFILFASTQPERRGRGFSAFLSDNRLPGLRVGRIEDKMGGRASRLAEVILDEHLLPADRLLGTEGSGLRIALETLNTARLSVGAQATGLAQGAFDYAMGYIKQRRQFAQRIADFQGVQFLLADLAMRLEAARALTYKAAALMDRQQQEAVHFAAMAKCFSSDMAMWVTTEAVQLLGGHGYTRTHPLERMMRDAKQLQILDGTNQIQRLVIARALVRD
jgi:alkylation response protein AidB-like acyl-CoA dehydrogenase